MAPERVLELLALAALACVGVAGFARTVALAARNVWVLPIDRERSVGEGLVDLAFLLGLAGFVYGAIALAAAPGWRAGPGALWDLALPWPALRWLGLAPAAAGAALYVAALRDFGASWRFTIDRARPGALVVTGVFARTRNPVYLALALVVSGAALALGHPLLLGLACAAPLYFRHLVRREERFLAAHYGAPYARYRERVPRWLGSKGTFFRRGRS